MSDRDAWQLAQDAAVAYEKDFVPAIFAQWPPVLAEVAEMKPGDRVLDVACGTGILAREAADRVGPAGRVTGLDLNEAMLAVARRLRPGIDWRQGDAGKLPFEDGAFDVAVREMWRVLAPRGRLAVAVCAPIAHTKGYAALAGILRREASGDAAAMVEGYFAIGDETALLRLCEAAGIAGASVLTREGWARFASIDELVRIEIKGSPLAGLVDETSYQRVLKEARQELRGFCDEQGKVSLRLDASIVTAAKP
jgi:SAM-dependent methyltransferase